MNSVIPAMRNSKNCEVVAIASRDINRARETASLVSIPNHFGNYEELINFEQVDAVYIALPNSLHRRWTIAAAKRGKHVLCEKPMGLNTRECNEMVEACKKNHVFLFEGYMYRFAPQIVRAIDLVKSGQVGKLLLIRSEFTFKLDDPNDIRFKKQLGGGSLYDVGCYCVDFSNILVGSEPILVRGTAHVRERKGVDIAFAGILRFARGEIAVFDCGFQPDLGHSVDIIGDKGRLHLPAAFEPGFSPEIVRIGDTTENIKLESADPYSVMVEHFSDCILRECTPRYSLAESLRTARTIDKLYQTAFHN